MSAISCDSMMTQRDTRHRQAHGETDRQRERRREKQCAKDSALKAVQQIR